MSDFVVAGGGISGLACALSLAGRGHRVQVLERNPGFTELGAGIQLAPNAFRALERLGVGAQVRRNAVHVTALELLDGISGRSLARLPLDREYRRTFGGPYAVVQRSDLYSALLAGCRAYDRVVLRSASAVIDYRVRGAGVECTLADGSRVRGDALVGADGIRSAVRRQILADGEPRVSGHTIYRCVLPMATVPPALRLDAVCLWAGPGWHFVQYPIAGGTRLNLAITRDDGATEVISGKPVERQTVRDTFTGLAELPAALLGLGDDWRTWVLCDRDPVSRWSDGPVVLVGDAAHPMLQYAAQGACMALEDAVALGDAVGGEPAALPRSFTRFTELRRDRTARVQSVARWMGDALYHASGRACAQRDALLAALSVQDLRDAVAWLHAY